MSAADTSPDRRASAQRALGENPTWYHTIELAPGVVTPGHVDLRGTAARLLPRDLHGRRALDVGTFDGFWAFALERAGAEVVATDVERLEAAEWPPLNRERLEAQARAGDLELGRGFRIAAEVLGSEARRVECNVYDLTPERIDGAVDIAVVGAILLHLRDPVRALERVFGAMRPGGQMILLEPFSIVDTLRAPRRPIARFSPLTSNFNWWLPNVSTLRAWARAAGFVDVRHRGAHRPPSRPEMRCWYYALTARRPG